MADQEIQNTVEMQDQGVGEPIVLVDQEVQAHVVGDSKEVQNVAEVTEQLMQTEILTCSQEVQATDFDLVTTKQQLNVLEFEKALQTQTLLNVDACLKRFYNEMQDVNSFGD